MSRINNTVVADLMTADVMVVGVQTAIAEVRVELTGSGLHALPTKSGTRLLPMWSVFLR